MRKSSFYRSLELIQLLDRPAYGYAMYQAARQAKALGLSAISVIEFGVASGNGLLSLEEHARRIAPLLGVKIELYGFDTATGLPPLQDYRDIKHQWQPGLFEMDVDALQARLKQSTLVIGDISDTVGNFHAQYKPAPVGAVLFDVDLYSSTVSALKIFDTGHENLLPRVRCYFDDILGNETALTNEYTGERLAIAEYNAKPGLRKITPVHHLLAKAWRRKWYHKSFVHHTFDHPRYTDFIGNPNQAIKLRQA